VHGISQNVLTEHKGPWHLRLQLNTTQKLNNTVLTRISNLLETRNRLEWTKPKPVLSMTNLAVTFLILYGQLDYTRHTLYSIHCLLLWHSSPCRHQNEKLILATA